MSVGKFVMLQIFPQTYYNYDNFEEFQREVFEKIDQALKILNKVALYQWKIQQQNWRKSMGYLKDKKYEVIWLNSFKQELSPIYYYLYVKFLIYYFTHINSI